MDAAGHQLIEVVRIFQENDLTEATLDLTPLRSLLASHGQGIILEVLVEQDEQVQVTSLGLAGQLS